MSKKANRMVAEFLAKHRDIYHEPMGHGDHRYRYGHLTLTWYHTGTVLVQGIGIGNLVFKQLNCKQCQGQPKILQALKFMVRQVEKKQSERTIEQTRKINATIQRRSDSKSIDYHRNLDRRIRERKKQA